MYEDQYLTPEEAAVLKAEREGWLKRWPRHCTVCHGWGVFTWTENHGLPGPGEQFADPCECCTASQPEGERQVCARCGEQGLTPEGEGPCSWCGWNYDDGLPDY